MKEIWIDIKGYIGLYMISNYGRVKSLARVINNNGGIYYIKELILKASKNGGYLQVVLNKDGKKTVKVHRLVAEAFISNTENKKEVNHINGIKDDNRVENLEWNTGSENVQHAWTNGLNKALKYEKNGNSKLTKEKALEIRKSILARKELVEIFNVSKSTIANIINKKTWKGI